MIEIIEDDQPYIMIADGVVIAHGSVNDGVNQVGMGLVKLPERISVGGYLDADIIIVLGTPDTTIHLNALNKLNRILEHKKSLAKLRKAKNIDDILELVTQK
jgi:mannitol/fructose-specific phosphotransferase system IIA component (Ntr-type)